MQTDFAVLPDDAVGLVLGRRDLFGREHLVEVDGRRSGAEVKTLGPRVADRFEGRRQRVLARVLLHVIEPARPVHDALDQGARFERPVNHVHDARGLMVDHIEHQASAQSTEIVRLSSPGWIESGRGERHFEPPVRGLAGRHLGFEFGQVGVGVVEAFGHGGVPAGVSHGPWLDRVAP